ncbi:MAG: hypothetical protein J6A04_00310 [Clostridia bacterium]|nr:hypothetical protein [Clostridia bacterium]
MERKNQGITLIALVITIIVLLILAAISINLALGEDGIIDRARWGAFVTKLTSIEEQVELAKEPDDNGSIILRKDKVFAEEYGGERISDGLKKDIVEVREGNINSGYTQEQINQKYESMKNAEGKIPELYYVLEKVSGEENGYLYDLKTGTAFKVIGEIIFKKEFHIYKAGNGRDDEDKIGPELPKPDDEIGDWIPIYTKENYTKIATEEQNYDIYNLENIKVGTYNMNKDSKYKLMVDLDFNNEQVDMIKGFTGTFNGNGHYLKNIKINSQNVTDDYYYYSKDIFKNYDDASSSKIGTPTGIFDRIVNAKIYNLGVTNANVTGYINSNGYGTNLGILVGDMAQSTIENCIVEESTATSNGRTQSGPAGGIVGWIYNTEEPSNLTKLKVDNVRVSSYSNTAGIVAVIMGNSNISECVAIDSKITLNGDREDIAGIVGTSWGGTVKIEKCKANNIELNNSMTSFDNYSSTCSAAGILGSASENVKIEVLGCSVDNIELPMAKNSGGIVGCLGGSSSGNNEEESIISDCITTNLKKTKSRADGGILGFAKYKKVKVVNCKVSNYEPAEITLPDTISSTGSNGTCCRGGIVGSAAYNNELIIDSCDVKDSYIIACNESMSNAGGILGGNLGSNLNADAKDIKNCSVENTTIISKGVGMTGNYRSGQTNAGGIAGELGGSNIISCTVNKCKIYTNIKNKYEGTYYTSMTNGCASGLAGCSDFYSYNCKVFKIEGCIVKDTEIKSDSFQASGCIGYFNGSDGYTILGCTVDNCDIEGKYNAGGICELGANGNLNISKCIVKNSHITSINGSAGGVSSCINTYYGASIDECTIDNCEIKNLEIASFINNSESCYARVGGMVGHIGVSSATITNSIVKNTNITSVYQGCGGIAGDITNGEKITGCNVENVTITAAGTSSGGIVGNSVVNSLLVEGCNVKKLNIIAEGANNGGIMGLGYGKVKDCEIDELQIASKASNNAGVLGVACSYGIEGTTVKNSIITSTGQFAGGMVGAGDCKEIVECNLIGTTITIENYGVGGITGGNVSSYGNYKIENCNVIDSEIKGKDKSVGGILGENCEVSSNATFIINGCKVENSKVTLEGADAKSVGGIIGNGFNIIDNEEATNINGCIVSNTQVKGVDYVGGISGAASTKITGCTVTNQSIITGRDCVGGIQGFGGILGESTITYRRKIYNSNSWESATKNATAWKASKITGCQVEDSTINASTNINYIQGKNSYYVSGFEGTKENDVIENCTNTEVTLNNI